MMWKRMLQRLRPPLTDDALKQAAREQTERIQATLERLGIQVELATHHRIDELEHELRRSQEDQHA